MFSQQRFRLLIGSAAVLFLAVALSADKKPPFLPTEKAFYADQSQLDFVRPGLTIQVSKAEIAADGTIKAWVKFTDRAGGPLDRTGILTPGPISVSFLIATIPASQTQYVSYITRQRTGGGRTVTQATGENTGAWQQLGSGEYLYTFLNKAPSDIDRTATHTVAVYGSRNLTEFDLGTSRADTAFNFIPAGGAVTKVRDLIRTSTCNKCHSQLAFHGSNRRSMEVCVICHTPQTPDPVTNNTTDMKVMIHKIHMGADLPSVVAGGKYGIGNADYSTIQNPSPNMACVVCHEPKSVSGATQADNWFAKPGRESCGSCHDQVNFASGKNHADLPQISDNQCSNCHPAQGEIDFDTSIKGAHMVPAETSLLGGVRFTIEAAADVAPGKKPTVTFSVKDKKGNPLAMSQMTSLRLYSGGPTSDIIGYIREDVLRAQGPGDGRYFWTFATAIPATAKGSWQFGIEGYRNSKVLEGTLKERTIRDVGPNAIFTASLDGSKPVARRAVVSDAKCNKCHYSVSFHGGNRNSEKMCVFCHNPTITEGANRESWNFPNMIHRFHEEVRYPGVLSNCSQCHEGDTHSLPLPAGLQPTVNGLAPVTPTPPVTNACLVCHNSPSAWSHATANTTTLGESCAVCHGRTSAYAVNKVHAQ